MKLRYQLFIGNRQGFQRLKPVYHSVDEATAASKVVQQQYPEHFVSLVPAHTMLERIISFVIDGDDSLPTWMVWLANGAGFVGACAIIYVFVTLMFGI